MCGICGIALADRELVPEEHTLVGMRDAMAHRGPDDVGAYVAPGIALGACRLKILDLSDRGHMPMQTPDGRFWITYNGEVYNYRELRSGLEASGYVFRSGTDTEVVLNLYAEQGPAMLDRLNGMFAFGIWDTRDRTLFLARDRLGVKPLFYATAGGRLYFASEIKALRAAGCPAAFDPDCWEELLCFRYVAGERTPYSGVRRLGAGHSLTWKDGRVRTQRWWRLDTRALALREHPPEDHLEWFAATFDDSVRMRRISDVPVGVLLSGGLDSSSVAASLARDGCSPIASFTVRFSEPGYDEGPLAREVAEQCKLDYHELTLSGPEMLQGLRRISALNDEPLAHHNDLHLWAISRFAKPFVTVLLSGEGADETMGGYVRYRPLRYAALLSGGAPLVSLLAAVFPAYRLRKLVRFLRAGTLEDWVVYNACDVLPGELEALGMRPKAEYPYRRAVLDEARQLYPRDLMRQAMYSDQHTFLASILDRNDRTTMGASIECRVPFLDYRLVEGLAALPSSQLLGRVRNKRVLRESLGSRLPASVRRHRKWGFGVPWSDYLRQIPECREVVAALPDAEVIRSSPFETPRVRDVVRGFLSGNTEHEALVLQLVMVVVWHEVISEGVSFKSDSGETWP
ncbi:MAG: asparagine synthase (glutamine-hydrolyzing) [Thermoanaerobaculia bacterium]